MADNTPAYSFSLPTVGGDGDLWGGLLNGNWSKVDDLLSGTIPIDGAVLTGADITADTITAVAGELTGVDLVDCVVGAKSLSVTDQIAEGIQQLIGLTPEINPVNGGTIATWLLTAGTAHTPTIIMESGQSITVVVSTTTGTIDWPAGVTWLSETVPILAEDADSVFEFFQVGLILYGAFVGTDKS